MYVKRVGIFLIVAALTAGMVGCVPLPSWNLDRNLEIRDWYDLHAVRNNLEGNHRLMNDLDATTAGYEELASPIANEGKGWKPIGYYDLSRARVSAFMGSFDGQRYEIRDLYIDRPDEDTVGLFGVISGSRSVEGGIVKNVGVVNATVTGRIYVGALVGYNHVGLWQPGNVRNCYSTGSVTGDKYVGGLMGSNDEGTVSGSYSVTSVTGRYFVGGLVGRNLDGTVMNSCSAGRVTGHDYVGGLVGQIEEGTVSNSYASGNVTGNRCVGGLVGMNHDGTVIDSYSIGSVSGDDDIGGLVGENVGAVSNSFWDVEASGMEESDGGTGKTTTEMKDIATFTDTETEGLDQPWNIAAVAPDETNLAYIWNIVDGETYPFLSWQSVV
jgi:hypothetical protein